MKLVLVVAVLVAGGCTSERAPDPCPDAGVDASAEILWGCSLEKWCADGSYNAFEITLPQTFRSEHEAELVLTERCESVPCFDLNGRPELSRCHASCSPATE